LIVPSAYYEISRVTSDGVVVEEHSDRDEVDDNILSCDGSTQISQHITLNSDDIQDFDDRHVEIIGTDLGIVNDREESDNVEGHVVGLKSANLSSSDIEIMPMDDSFTEVIEEEEEPVHSMKLTSSHFVRSTSNDADSVTGMSSFSDVLLTSTTSDL
jgi:hypothetical protein